MSILMTQITELEAKNRSLQAAAQTQQHQRAVNGSSRDRPILQAAGSSERVQVEVITSSAGAASTSSSSFSPADHYREVIIRVAAPGDLSELVARVLALLRDTAGHRFTVVAVDGRRPDTDGDGIARASLTLRVTVRSNHLTSRCLRIAAAVMSRTVRSAREIWWVQPLRPGQSPTGLAPSIWPTATARALPAKTLRESLTKP
jgi:hypothetical protein